MGGFFKKILFLCIMLGGVSCLAKISPARYESIVRILERSYQERYDAFVAAIIAEEAKNALREKLSADYIVSCAQARVKILETISLITRQIGAAYPTDAERLIVRLEVVYKRLTADIWGLVSPQF